MSTAPTAADSARFMAQLDADDPAGRALLDYALDHLPELLPEALQSIGAGLDERVIDLFRGALFFDDRDDETAVCGLLLTAVVNAAESRLQASQAGTASVIHTPV